MNEEDNPSPRIRLARRETFSLTSGATSLGQLMWDKLSPEKQALLEPPIRRVEQQLARQFPEGYVSPLVAKAASIPGIQLERQTDATSCTYVATANALRVLDQPKPDYSRVALKNRIEQLSGRDEDAIYSADLDRIFNSGSPYDQFVLQKFEQPRLRMPQTSPEMRNFLRAFQDGKVAVAGWRLWPDAIRSAGGGILGHARTIVGFSKGPNETIMLHVIDPYGARQEKWSFRDWVIASNMDIHFDNPSVDMEEIRKISEFLSRKGGVMAATASYVWIIYKKKPRLILTRNR